MEDKGVGQKVPIHIAPANGGMAVASAPEVLTGHAPHLRRGPVDPVGQPLPRAAADVADWGLPVEIGPTVTAAGRANVVLLAPLVVLDVFRGTPKREPVEEPFHADLSF